MPFDRVRETSVTIGTGPLTLTGAPAGFRAFASAYTPGAGDVIRYVIEGVDANGAQTGEWEVGVGALAGDGTLTRGGVVASSNAGALVSFSAGTKRVYDAATVGAVDAAAAALIATHSAGADPHNWLEQNIGRGKVGLWLPQGWATNVTSIGIGAPVTIGTPAARALATTSLLTAQRRYAMTTGAGAGSAALIYSNNHPLPLWRQFGFRFIARVAISDPVLVSGGRTFFGLIGAVAFTANEPTTFVNMMGFGTTTGDANLSIMHNDSSGTATKIDLGSSFPVNLTDVYELMLDCEPGAATVTWRVRNVSTGAEATGTISTNLPADTVQLLIQLQRSNGATAAVVGFDLIACGFSEKR
jgi:hypothetical protein